MSQDNDKKIGKVKWKNEVSNHALVGSSHDYLSDEDYKYNDASSSSSSSSSSSYSSSERSGYSSSSSSTSSEDTESGHESPVTGRNGRNVNAPSFLDSSKLSSSQSEKSSYQFGLPRFQIRNRRSSRVSTNNNGEDGASSKQFSSLSSTSVSGISSDGISSHTSSRQHDHQSTYQRQRQNRRRSGLNFTTISEPQSVFSLYKISFQMIFAKRSSVILVFSFLIWLYVQFQYASHVHNNTANSLQSTIKNKNLQEKVKQIRAKRQQSALAALGSAAGEYFKGKGKQYHTDKKSKDGYTPAQDRLPRNCSPQEWQNFNFPNCNDVHDLDLGEVLDYQRRWQQAQKKAQKGYSREHQRNRQDQTLKSKRKSYKNLLSETGVEEELKMGYMGSGLWRQVWKLQPRRNGEYAVLKIMKMQHDVNPRNFDRHRRDALVMERLSKDDHVISIMGFCGNTVLTEHAALTLDDFLFEGKRPAKWAKTENGDEEQVTGIEKYKEENALHKIELALDVMKGLKAMHDLNIVHADVQAKQFLIDPEHGVKVNDFNRCRLLPKHDQTGKICKVKIPSAPGGQRSPEEYELKRIDTKIDVFSTGNVLYGILTGRKPWTEDFMKRDIQRNVMKGIKPAIGGKFRLPGTVDGALAEIVLKAYAFLPEERWSSAKIIEELERIRRDQAEGKLL